MFFYHLFIVLCFVQKKLVLFHLLSAGTTTLAATSLNMILDSEKWTLHVHSVDHRHLGPGYLFSSNLSIKCASTTYMNPFDMFRCEINAFMNYAPFS